MHLVARFVTASAISVALLAAADPMPQVGQQAPAFTLPSQDGSDVSLKDFHGKYVVLYFYPKDGTSGCTLEAHNFERDLPKYEADNAVILGVSVDSASSHKQFCTQQSLTFKLLSDVNKTAVKEYGSERGMLGITLAARNTFLIDPEGRILKEWVGVNPSLHSQEVLQALEELKKK